MERVKTKEIRIKEDRMEKGKMKESVLGENRMERAQHKESRVKELESKLIKNWRELSRMLTCSKIWYCAPQYSHTFHLGNEIITANLVQSLTITLHRIKDITTKLKMMGSTKY